MIILEIFIKTKNFSCKLTNFFFCIHSGFYGLIVGKEIVYNGLLLNKVDL